MWSMTLKISKPERFLCKSRERFIIIVAQRRGDGEFMWTETNPSPKRKKNQLRVLGGGGVIS
jgi:hypothetical protein